MVTLIEGIGYTESKKYIEMNNAFKEFNIWINEMYTRLSYYDNEGGWEKVGIEDYRRAKENLRRNQRYYYTGEEISIKFKQTFGFRGE